jgi:AraC-like DNA-binding protein/quercetin dioxygenase-like cupin family protein
MKPIFEQVTKHTESTLLIRRYIQPKFDVAYHFHPEIELTYIKKSHGKRYIGGNVSEYSPGDLVLVGSNTPHCWLSHDNKGSDSAQAIVIQFQKEFIGEPFWELPESVEIKSLITRANTGILIKGGTNKKIQKMMERIESEKSFLKLIHVMEILHVIAESDETESISNSYETFIFSPTEANRFQKIFNFLIENFQHDIQLKDIATVANLTQTAFCRYFKSVTHKTFIEVIVEFRINHACQLLRTTEKLVADICFESGFGNISYFNKTFKTAIGSSPLQYRNLFMKSKR